VSRGVGDLAPAENSSSTAGGRRNSIPALAPPDPSPLSIATTAAATLTETSPSLLGSAGRYPTPILAASPTHLRAIQKDLTGHMAGSALPTSGAREAHRSRELAARASSQLLVRSQGAEKMKSIMAFLDEVEAKVEQEHSQQHHAQTTNPTPRAAISSNKFLSALENSGTGGEQGIGKEAAGPTSFAGGMGDGVVRASTGAGGVFDGVKAKLLHYKVQLEDKDATVKVLQENLAAHGERERRLLQQQREEANARLAEQKASFEQVIQRQLAFIDGILKDKETLTGLCEERSQLLVAAEEKAARLLEDTRQAAERNLQKQKEVWAAAEKIRRDTWVAKKTKTIKELTIKGLEPEIQRLLSANKDEIKRLEAAHQDELRRQKLELRDEAERQVAQLRDALAQERAAAVERERETCTKRLRDQIDRYDRQMVEQRERANRELERERQSWMQTKRDEVAALQDQLALYKRQDESRFSQLRSEHGESLEAVKRRSELALEQERERERLEREQWKANILAKLNKDLQAKEQEMRAVLTKERDDELEMVISRLSEETAEAQRSLISSYEKKLTALEQQCSDEKDKARSRETQWQERLRAAAELKSTAEKESSGASSQLASLRLAAKEKEREATSLASGMQVILFWCLWRCL
jgi:5-azacytidine-induced protein 1